MQGHCALEASATTFQQFLFLYILISKLFRFLSLSMTWGAVLQDTRHMSDELGSKQNRWQHIVSIYIYRDTIHHNTTQARIFSFWTQTNSESPAYKKGLANYYPTNTWQVSRPTDVCGYVVLPY